ncbi:MAG TPA: hypothetical protein VK694_07900 [Verrucomicrobiae bacterium]|nr:hypothetical protein [Verrucomicrobiae bacterium]
MELEEQSAHKIQELLAAGRVTRAVGDGVGIAATHEGDLDRLGADLADVAVAVRTHRLQLTEPSVGFGLDAALDGSGGQAGLDGFVQRHAHGLIERHGDAPYPVVVAVTAVVLRWPGVVDVSAYPGINGVVQRYS